VVGDIDPVTTLRWILRYFGPIPAAGRSRRARSTAPAGPAPAVRRQTVTGPVPTGAVHACYLLPADGSREADAADLALAVVGRGARSRIGERLVRRDQTAATSRFRLVRLTGAASLGWLDVPAAGDVPADVLTEAIDAEIDRFAAEGPTERELDRVRAQTERAWLDRFATVGGRADELCRFTLQAGDPGLAARAVDRMLTVRADEIRRVARRWLRPENRVLLAYRPESPATGHAHPVPVGATV
jgi:predicted Zn-dependent peptidase